MEKKTRLPPDFAVSPRIMELAREQGWPDPRKELEAFKDHHLAEGSLKQDWEAAFRTWLRRTITMSKGKFTPLAPAPVKQMELPEGEHRPEEAAKVRSMMSDLAAKFNVRKKA